MKVISQQPFCFLTMTLLLPIYNSYFTLLLHSSNFCPFIFFFLHLIIFLWLQRVGTFPFMVILLFFGLWTPAPCNTKDICFPRGKRDWWIVVRISLWSKVHSKHFSHDKNVEFSCIDYVDTAYIHRKILNRSLRT